MDGNEHNEAGSVERASAGPGEFKGNFRAEAGASGFWVRGDLFVDYVRMIRSRKDIDWSRHLPPEDLALVRERIMADSWYPMGVLERMGAAILKKIAGGNLDQVRQWGRIRAGLLAERHSELVAAGNPRETLVRYQTFTRKYFNFDSISMLALFPNFARLETTYHMTPAAEQFADYQMLGSLERLLELSGANNVHHSFPTAIWKSDPPTVLELSWSNVTPEMKVKGGLFLDQVRMLKNEPGRDWSKYLLPRDQAYLQEQILPSEWYPLETFERMGLAIFHEIAHRQLDTVFTFGLNQFKEMAHVFPELVCLGDPRESLARLQDLSRNLFNFSPVEIESVSEGRARVKLHFRMSRAAEQAACYQTAGYFVQLLSECCGQEVRHQFIAKSWEGDPSTILELTWEKASLSLDH